MMFGCFVTIIAAFMQCFAPKGVLGCFIAGRVIIGIGQGIALSMSIYPVSPLRHRRRLRCAVFYSFSCFDSMIPIALALWACMIPGWTGMLTTNFLQQPMGPSTSTKSRPPTSAVTS